MDGAVLTPAASARNAAGVFSCDESLPAKTRRTAVEAASKTATGLADCDPWLESAASAHSRRWRQWSMRRRVSAVAHCRACTDPRIQRVKKKAWSTRSLVAAAKVLSVRAMKAQSRCSEISTERVSLARFVPMGIASHSGARRGPGARTPPSPSSVSSFPSTAAAAAPPASLRLRPRAGDADAARPPGGAAEAAAEAAAAAAPVNVSDVLRMRQFGIQSEARKPRALARA